MDSASKNATDMIASLQMQYNRGRQAAITNELVDIITGTLLIPVAPFSTDAPPRCQCSLNAFVSHTVDAGCSLVHSFIPPT